MQYKCLPCSVQGTRLRNETEDAANDNDRRAQQGSQPGSRFVLCLSAVAIYRVSDCVTANGHCQLSCTFTFAGNSPGFERLDVNVVVLNKHGNHWVVMEEESRLLRQRLGLASFRTAQDLAHHVEWTLAGERGCQALHWLSHKNGYARGFKHEGCHWRQSLNLCVGCEKASSLL